MLSEKLVSRGVPAEGGLADDVVSISCSVIGGRVMTLPMFMGSYPFMGILRGHADPLFGSHS